MSEQERPSLRNIESARSQITNKFKGNQEEEENGKSMDAVNDFLSRIGANENVPDSKESETETRDIKDIFASLTADEDSEQEENVLKPEISYQEIQSADPEQEEIVDIYAKDTGDVGNKAVKEDDGNEFLKKLQSEPTVSAYSQSKAKLELREDSRGEFIIVEENDGNLLIVFEKGGENAVSLKMPAASIPDGHSVNAMLAPDINLSLTYKRKVQGKDILTVVLEHGVHSVRTEVISGKPFVRKIAFGEMEFELFAGAEVTAGMFSIFVEEKRVVYKY